MNHQQEEMNLQNEQMKINVSSMYYLKNHSQKTFHDIVIF